MVAEVLEEFSFELDDTPPSLLEDATELEDESSRLLEDFPFELDDTPPSLLEDATELEEIFSSVEDDVSRAASGLFFKDSFSPQATKMKKNKNKFNNFSFILCPFSCSIAYNYDYIVDLRTLYVWN